ncbi:MAG: phosphotransferase family protein, partial [Pseudonocardiaceae bacterium]
MPALLPHLLRPYRTLHDTALDGYGWLAPDFTGRHPSWRSYLLDLEEDPDLTAVPAWQPRREALVSLLAAVPEVVSARLLYGDYNRDNFLVTTDGTLVALDFQGCFAGDPLYDWATILLKEPHNVPLLTHLLQPTDGHWRRITAYQARVLWSMAVYHSSRDPRRTEALTYQLDIVLDVDLRRQRCSTLGPRPVSRESPNCSMTSCAATNSPVDIHVRRQCTRCCPRRARATLLRRLSRHLRNRPRPRRDTRHRSHPRD